MPSKLPFARCGECPLHDMRVVPGAGPNDHPEIMVIGEAPGATEEEQGVPFVGQSGKLLDIAFAEAGAAFGSSLVYKTNVVACRPPGNRTPTPFEMECCSERLKHEIRTVAPQRIVTLGATAAEAMNVPFNQKGAIYMREGTPVMPAWHPAYVLRSPDDASEFLDQMRRAYEGPFVEQYIPWPDPIWVETLDDLESWLAKCPDGAWVSYDIETDQVQWYSTEEKHADSILMLQIAWEPGWALILSDEMLYDTPGCVEMLQKFFNRVNTVAHNGKFDCVFLESHVGLKIFQEFDTMLAHYTLNENIKHGLKFLARHEFGIPDYEEETIAQYLNSKNDRYSKIPPDEFAKYGAMDVVCTLKFREMLEKKLRDQGLYEWPFMNILMRASNGLTQVEQRGMYIDKDQLERSSEELSGVLQELTGRLRTMSGNENLNPNSTQQLAVVLWDEMKITPPKTRKGNPRSTNKEALEKILGAHPIIPEIQHYRRVKKMHSSYIENLLYYVDVNGRLHADFRVIGTEVSRLAVADPPLQTVPRPSDYFGALIRSSFVASPGNVLLMADFSQAELRVFACMSGEPFLIKVYQDGRDLHSEVAIGMYGDDYTKEQRVQCKMFNFSYLYGGSEYSFAQDSGLKIEVAKKFVRDYNALMPVGLQWKRDQLHRLKTEGFVETRFGRRRRFPFITNDNLDDARKAAVHMPCASSASDLTLLSACDLIEKGVPVVLTVHDSILIDCPPSLADEFGEMMVRAMTGNATKWFPEVPWEVDYEVTDRWAQPRPDLRPAYA